MNMLHPGVCWMILNTNTLFYLCAAEYCSAIWFQFVLRLPKNVVRDRRRERERYTAGINRVVAQLSGDTLKQKWVELMQCFT